MRRGSLFTIFRFRMSSLPVTRYLSALNGFRPKKAPVNFHLLTYTQWRGRHIDLTLDAPLFLRYLRKTCECGGSWTPRLSFFFGTHDHTFFAHVKTSDPSHLGQVTKSCQVTSPQKKWMLVIVTPNDRSPWNVKWLISVTVSIYNMPILEVW